MLNFILKVNLPGKIDAMIRLSSSFVPRILSIKKTNWISNKKKRDNSTRYYKKKSRTCIYFVNKSRKL